MTGKIKKLLRSRDGFTLAETITATALLVVLIALCSTLILSTMSGTARITAVMEERSLGDAIFDYVSECLRYGENLALGDGSGPETVSVDEGVLVRRVNGGALAPVYSEDLYGRCMLSLSVTGTGETVELDVQLIRDGETRYSRSGSVRLLNAAATGSGAYFSFA